MNHNELPTTKAHGTADVRVYQDLSLREGKRVKTRAEIAAQYPDATVTFVDGLVIVVGGSRGDGDNE